MSKKCKNLSMKIMGNNCAGLKGKKESFENFLKVMCPSVAMLQETKLYRKGTMQFENCSCFEKVRGDKEGGGLMTLVHKNLDPIFIPTKSLLKMSLDVLVIEVKLKDLKTRFINA